MADIVIDRTNINFEALDAEIRTALGNITSGISVGGGKVVVHLAANATQQQMNQVRAIVQAHNPAQLTPGQQAEIQRRQRLNQARQDYGSTPLDLTVYGSVDANMRRLAQKIYWLEQEIAELRGGKASEG